jgi:Zn finger protein HypA/HybF involved in hydrogenase expression
VPPAVVKNVQDLIYWQYAKIIAQSAGFSKKDYGFVTCKFKQLNQGNILWNELREYVKEKGQRECGYCGATADLTLEHLLPRKFNGPDNERNVVWVCKSCNSKKGAKRLYEYHVYNGGLNEAKYNVPRIAEGKYLKFAYETLQANKMLQLKISDLTAQVCPKCDLKPLCIKEDTEGKLSTLCIDGLLTLCFKKSG